jgi:hypothetical protein
MYPILQYIDTIVPQLDLMVPYLPYLIPHLPHLVNHMDQLVPYTTDLIKAFGPALPYTHKALPMAMPLLPLVTKGIDKINRRKADKPVVLPKGVHILEWNSYKKPTVCVVCKKMLWGISNQGLACRGKKQRFLRVFK